MGIIDDTIDWFTGGGGDGGSGSGSSSPSIDLGGIRSRLSDLESSVSALAGLTSASALGIALVDDPVLFVQAVVIEWIVGGFISLAGEVAAVISFAWITVTDAFIESGQLILAPFGIVGESVTDAIILIGTQIDTIAASSGPFAPLIAIVIWGMIVFFVATLLRSSLEVLKWI